MSSKDEILTAIRDGLTRTNELATKTGYPEDLVCRVCNRLQRESMVVRISDADGYQYTPRGNWERRTLR